jgi:hypothetical protein
LQVDRGHDATLDLLEPGRTEGDTAAAARERESSDEPRLRFPRRCFIGRLAREETGSKCRRKRKAKDS